MISKLASGLPPATTSTSTAPAPRDALQARDDAKLKQAQTALDTLSRRRSSASDDRKAAAKKKIDDLKQRIRMLKMTMSAAGSKGASRIVAQLARELREAVKAYGGTGGSVTDLASTATTAIAPAEAQGVEEEGAAGADADGTRQAEAPQEATTAGEAGETTDKDRPDAAAGENAAPSDPYRKAIDEQQAQAAEQARKAEKAKEDSEFIAAVKNLLAELKAMSKKAKADGKASGEGDAEAKAADDALEAVKREIDSAAGNLSGGVVSLTI